MDKFNISITSADFDVEPVVLQESSAIFLGIRKLFYHFVVITENNSGNFHHINTNQVHIHRHEMAGAYAGLLTRSTQKISEGIYSEELGEGVNLSLDENGELWINFNFIRISGRIDHETGQWFLDELNKGADQLQLAETSLKLKKTRSSLAKKFGVPEHECDFSHPVWQCVQFEKQISAQRKINNRSITHLHQHFVKGKPEPEDWTLSDFSYTLDSLDPSCECDFCQENGSMYERIQEIYFPEPFYSRGKPKSELEKVKSAVLKMYNGLLPRDQISLLYLCDSSPMILMTLGWFAGLKTAQSLIALVCTEFQPDSKEEQMVREEISTVQYFRKLV